MSESFTGYHILLLELISFQKLQPPKHRQRQIVNYVVHIQRLHKLQYHRRFLVLFSMLYPLFNKLPSSWMIRCHKSVLSLLGSEVYATGPALYCSIRSQYNFLNNDFKRTMTYSCLSSLMKSHVASELNIHIRCKSEHIVSVVRCKLNGMAKIEYSIICLLRILCIPDSCLIRPKILVQIIFPYTSMLKTPL